MLNLNSLLIGSPNPKKLADFYQKVLGKVPDWEDGDWTGFSCGDGFITIGHHDKVKGKAKHPERVIFNFETKDVQGEFARIKKLGATVVAAPYHPMEDEKTWIATFADPDGNYFQLMSPWEG